MGWSLKSWPQGLGSSPRCGLRQLQGAARAVGGWGVRPLQHRLPEALPRQPGSAPTARSSLCKRLPSGGLGPCTNRLAYLYSAFSQNRRLRLRKGLKTWARSEMRGESRNKERKSAAEDLCTRSCQRGEGEGPEALWAPLSHSAGWAGLRHPVK